MQETDDVRRRIRARLPGLLARRERRAAWLYGRWAILWLSDPEPWAWTPEERAEHAVECAVRAAHHGRRALAFRPARISVPRFRHRNPARISVPRFRHRNACESEPS